MPGDEIVRQPAGELAGFQLAGDRLVHVEVHGASPTARRPGGPRHDLTRTRSQANCSAVQHDRADMADMRGSGLSGRADGAKTAATARPPFLKSAGIGRASSRHEADRHDREADAGRAQLRVGADLAGDAHRARRDSAVQHARRDARRSARARCSSSRSCSGRRFALGGWKNVAHLAVSGILNVLSFSLLSVIAMMFAATGRVAMLVLHDADLGRAVRLARARRTVHARARRRARPVRRRHGDPDLAAAAQPAIRSGC